MSAASQTQSSLVACLSTNEAEAMRRVLYEALLSSHPAVIATVDQALRGTARTVPLPPAARSLERVDVYRGLSQLERAIRSECTPAEYLQQLAGDEAETPRR